MDDLVARVSAVLTSTPARWQRLTETLPADLLNRPPAPGEWSATDCLKHLLDAERFVFPVRVRAFLAGEERLVNFDPDAQPAPAEPPNVVQLAASFDQARTASLALLTRVTPDDLGRSAIHSALGNVTLGEMLQEWAAHDLMHTVQAERALMQPFIAECGPWQVFFEDHIARQDA